MVTVVGKTAEGLGVYRGLSTDLPITPAPKNGSRFFAMDNGKTYWYDGASNTWEGYAGGGGASELSDLGDVDLEGLADGDFLKYDEDSDKWVPGTGGGGTSIPGWYLTDIEELTNTDTTATMQARLKDLADQLKAKLESLSSDERYVITGFERGTNLYPYLGLKMWDSTSSAGKGFRAIAVNATTCTIESINVNQTLGNCGWFVMDITSSGNTITNNSSNTYNGTLTIQLIKYKQII